MGISLSLDKIKDLFRGRSDLLDKGKIDRLLAAQRPQEAAKIFEEEMRRLSALIDQRQDKHKDLNAEKTYLLTKYADAKKSGDDLTQDFLRDKVEMLQSQLERISDERRLLKEKWKEINSLVGASELMGVTKGDESFIRISDHLTDMVEDRAVTRDEAREAARVNEDARRKLAGLPGEKSANEMRSDFERKFGIADDEE